MMMMSPALETLDRKATPINIKMITAAALKKNEITSNVEPISHFLSSACGPGPASPACFLSCVNFPDRLQVCAPELQSFPAGPLRDNSQSGQILLAGASPTASCQGSGHGIQS